MVPGAGVDCFDRIKTERALARPQGEVHGCTESTRTACRAEQSCT